MTGWEIGAEVCALLSGGGYAERVAVPAGQLLPLPGRLSLVDAAALPEVACTVWSNVGHARPPAPGRDVPGARRRLRHRHDAIQVAKRLGARVLCTAGSAAKRERCRQLGADAAIDYRDEDFVAGPGRRPAAAAST